MRAALESAHPFIDGNKRGGSNCRLAFTDAAAYSFLMDLYENGRMRFDELDAWLRQHSIAE